MSAPASWSALAEDFLERALANLRDGLDPIPYAEGALAALRAPEASEAVGGDLWRELASSVELDEPPCTCAPDLAARGGFTSSCPAHGGTR